MEYDTLQKLAISLVELVGTVSVFGATAIVHYSDRDDGPTRLGLLSGSAGRRRVQREGEVGEDRIMLDPNPEFPRRFE
jgi:hypothetical protein